MFNTERTKLLDRPEGTPKVKRSISAIRSLSPQPGNDRGLRRPDSVDVFPDLDRPVTSAPVSRNQSVSRTLATALGNDPEVSSIRSGRSFVVRVDEPNVARQRRSSRFERPDINANRAVNGASAVRGESESGQHYGSDFRSPSRVRTIRLISLARRLLGGTEETSGPAGVQTVAEITQEIEETQHGHDRQDDCDCESTASSHLGGDNGSGANFYMPRTELDTTQYYISYYVPFMSWLPKYNLSLFWGDLVAGLSLSSFQIPLSMSYATSLAHVAPACGLFGLVVQPVLYALMGSVPQMVVGPEAAISLVVGQAVEISTRKDYDGDGYPDISTGDVTSVLAGASGGILLAAGLLRLGYLDNVLSRALLQGFISAVGIVMIISSTITELGLSKKFDESPRLYHSPFEKCIFIWQNRYEVQLFTLFIALTAIGFMLAVRSLKAYCAEKKSMKWLVFVPEILIAVIVSTICSNVFDWDDNYGVEIVGAITPGKIDISFPITARTWRFFTDSFTASFLVAVLGFFESTTAAKALGSTFDYNISSNRELVALGVSNLVGSLFSALPAFGGYGRSKINVLSGGKTLMAGCVMSVITLISLNYFMHYFYYLPKCVLSGVVTVVGVSLLEESPEDVKFHWRTRGYEELFTFFITLVVTIFFSVEIGVLLGVAFSFLRVIRHATKSRIQILGRIPHTSTFLNADEFEEYDRYINMHNDANKNDPLLEVLEEIEGCLIVKVPEPLTFANAGDLRSRLKRLELYGSLKIHPGHPRTRGEVMTRFLIIDLHGVSEIDSSALQILKEIVTSYKKRGIKVLLTRVPYNIEIRNGLERSEITKLISRPDETLRAYENPLLHPMYANGKQRPRLYFSSIDEALLAVDNMDRQRNGQSSCN